MMFIFLNWRSLSLLIAPKGNERIQLQADMKMIKRVKRKIKQCGYWITLVLINLQMSMINVIKRMLSIICMNFLINTKKEDKFSKRIQLIFFKWKRSRRRERMRRERLMRRGGIMFEEEEEDMMLIMIWHNFR